MISKDPREIPEQCRAARDLVSFALYHGWVFATITPEPDSAGDLFFKILLKRYVTDDTGAAMTEAFQITWHTRATGGRTYRLFSKLYRAAGRGVWTDAPSLRQIKEVISGAGEGPQL